MKINKENVEKLEVLAQQLTSITIAIDDLNDMHTYDIVDILLRSRDLRDSSVCTVRLPIASSILQLMLLNELREMRRNTKEEIIQLVNS